jgi:methionyl-tRNA formyltransferase
LHDEQVDHGPVLAQKEIQFETWPLERRLVEEELAETGAKLLLESVPTWLAGKIKAQEQNHTHATFTKKINKKDGQINLSDSTDINFKKYCAFDGWPGTYFFVNKNEKEIRVHIKKASLQNGKFVIEKVIPEGRKEMDYKSFLLGL